MNRIKHLLKDLAILIRANLWLIPVIAALVAAVFYFVAPPPPMSATMATGAEGGGYAVFAGKLREKLKEQGFELKLVPSAGSRDNLERLLGTGEVDIALVQSGQERQLEAGQARQLQTLGAVYQEPLWLFHRSNVHIDQLSDLLHLRLAIGSDGSGTRAATEAILQANDIAPGHYPITWEARGGNAVVDDLLAGKLGRGVHRRPGGEPGDPEIGRQRPASPGQLPPQRRLRGAPAVPQAGRGRRRPAQPAAQRAGTKHQHPVAGGHPGDQRTLPPGADPAGAGSRARGDEGRQPARQARRLPQRRAAHPAPARGRRALLQERPAAAAALPAVPHRLPGGPLHHPADPVSSPSSSR
ncbi:periplasmic transport protein [Pseudomonas aeruginosa]|nr:periplasmic transport protein [Pseudomonas aeruginosa]